MKTCTLCKIEKPLTEFGAMTKAKDGLQFRCKPCLSAKGKDYYAKNKSKINADSKRYREANKERLSGYLKTWNENNKEYVSADRKKYYRENIETIREKRAVARKRNANKIAAHNKRWKAANRDRVNSYNRDTVMLRYKEDPLFALLMNSRRRLLLAFANKGYSKRSTTAKLLGCDMETLSLHLESKFTEGMTWANRGFYGWHVDHVVPLASARNVEELERLCHYTNLQPLWAADNIAKGARTPEVPRGRLDNVQTEGC